MGSGISAPRMSPSSSLAVVNQTLTKVSSSHASGSRGSRQDLTPLSASGYFEQALEVNPPDNSTTFRVYLNPASPSKESKYGTYLVCHHGAGSSGLSFAALAKEVKASSGGELGVLSFDCRGHGERFLSLGANRLGN